MEKWWKDHGQRHDDPEWLKWIEIYREIVTEKLLEQTEEHINQVDGKKLFGMSGAGGCTRDKSLGYLGYKDEPSGSEMWTFMNGHIIECAALATLTCLMREPVQRQVNVSIGPFMSKSDAKVNVFGEDMLVSVKSAGYKMSGRRKSGKEYKWTRFGFAELPFEGIVKSHPAYYVQACLEMAATGIRKTMFLVCAKDMVKAFENDDFLGPNGNGSLSFYTEIVQANDQLANMAISLWTDQLELAEKGQAGAALYLTKDLEYVKLNLHEYNPDDIWGGENKKITGSFNPCGGCSRRKACEVEDKD